jgi:hypothetical protein
MAVFNNIQILKSDDDVVLGAVISEEESFDFKKYSSLLSDRIENLIINYVDDSLKSVFRAISNINTKEIDVCSDIADKVREKLNVYVYFEDENFPFAIANAIMSSEQFKNFILNIKQGFDIYENSIAFLPNGVPVTTLNENEDYYFSEESVYETLLDRNIMDYIETLSTYGIPTLL